MNDPWASHDLAEGQEARWQLGALGLSVTREPGAWRLEWGWGAGPRQACRVAFARTEGPLVLAPRLADTAVVVRPAEPLRVAPGEEVLVYATTPLWVAVLAADGRQPLAEIACAALSPTWFGADTCSGELCLAGHRPLAGTPAAEPCEVLTPVLLQNRAEQPLPVERLRLPLVRLPLFRAADGGFWTPLVTVRQRENGARAELSTGDLAPFQARRPRLVAAARPGASGGGVLTALGSVLRHPLF